MLKNLSFRSCKISFSSQISMPSSLKKTEVKVELLSDTDMLLVVEKGIIGEIYHTIHWYAKDNNE